MKLYKEDNNTILQAQNHDPLLDHLTNHIISYFQLSKGKRLLDIGCGSGRLGLKAAGQGYNVVGVDIEKRAIDLAKYDVRRWGLEKKCVFIHGDIFALKKLGGRRFDVIVSSEVIEHVKDPEKVISIAYKLLKKRGLIILTTPHDPKQWTVLDEYAQHVKRFSVSEIRKMFTGFKILNLYTVGFPFMRSIMLIYNLISKLMGRKHTSSWRNNVSKGMLYSWVVSKLLKIDDLFNFLHMGTTIVVVARKEM